MTTARQHSSLDLVRGLAALGILFWHYAHFFFVAPETAAPGFTFAEEPLYFLFFPLYRWGYLAVQLFFVVSGFVFFLVYAAPVASGAIDLKRFFGLRLSRLYPLHLATLIVVALLQWALAAQGQPPFAFGRNDAGHFILNLLFIQGWGFGGGFSFNGPTWSVSLEMLVYGLFFVVASLSLANLRVSLVMVAVGAALMTTSSPGIGQAMAGFFLGGTVYLLCRSLAGEERRRRRRLVIAASLALLAVTGGLLTILDWPVGEKLVIFLAFPLVILVLVLIEDDLPRLFTWSKPLGDLTYATYLLHFPVQLAIMVAVTALGLDPDFHSPAMLFVYLALVIGLAIPTYRYFEMPAQRYLRSQAWRLPLRARFRHRNAQTPN